MPENWKNFVLFSEKFQKQSNFRQDFGKIIVYYKENFEEIGRKLRILGKRLFNVLGQF